MGGASSVMVIIWFQGNVILSALHNKDSENDNTHAQRSTGRGEITRSISSFHDYFHGHLPRGTRVISRYFNILLSMLTLQASCQVVNVDHVFASSFVIFYLCFEDTKYIYV